MGRTAIGARAGHAGLLETEDPLHLAQLGVGLLEHGGALDEHVEPDGTGGYTERPIRARLLDPVS